MTLGYWRGLFDEMIMRLMNAILALPGLLILLLVASLFGTTATVLILALSFLYGIAVRIARTATLSFVSQKFIIAAYAIGAPHHTIILRELLPNVLDILLVEGLCIGHGCSCPLVPSLF